MLLLILPLDSIQYLTYNFLVLGERNSQPFVIAIITLSLVLIVVIGLLKWQQRQKVRAERRNAEARLQRPRHADTAIRSPEYAQPTEQQEHTYEKVRNVSAFFRLTLQWILPVLLITEMKIRGVDGVSLSRSVDQFQLNFCVR